MNELEFWIVWREHGAAPTYQHQMEHSAKSEAQRLARLNPDVKFYVGHVKGYALVEAPVLWRDLMEIPF